MLTPPDPAAFARAVYEIVQRVPLGRVTTYGNIARMLATPAGIDADEYARLGARWVGAALRGCPPQLPWQRVINAQGRVSARPGAGRQRELLEQEGILFDETERVDMRVYGWPEDTRDRQLRLL